MVVFQGMCLVVSVTNGSALLQAFSKKKGAILFPLGQLSMTDRKEIVQKGLDMFGKKLSEAAFNNQVQNSYCSTFYCVCVCVLLHSSISINTICLMKLKASLEINKVNLCMYINVMYITYCVCASVQLQTLMMKNGAGSPLYLHLACEDLRNFASFEKV